MVILVLVIGALNFAIGFGLAILLERPLAFPLPGFTRRFRWKRSKRSAKVRPVRTTDGEEKTATQVLSPALAVSEKPDIGPLLPEWRDILDTKPVVAHSFTEATLWVTDSRIHDCGTLLRKLESRTHHPLTESIVNELEPLIAEEQAKLEKTKAAIEEYQKTEPPAEQLALSVGWLDEAHRLLNQLGPGRELKDSPSDSAVDPSAFRHRLLECFSHVCKLSEKCQDCLAQLLFSQQRLKSLPESVVHDLEVPVLNRFGREIALEQWIEKDQERVRMVSLILLDIDQCAQLNERWGIARSDQLLSAAVGLSLEIVRKDRGFDRVVRVTPQSVLIFLGDTATRNAVLAAERMRQHLGIAIFRSNETKISLTASCAVTEWNASESFDELMERLRVGIREAKTAGGNCTVSCNFDDMRVVQPSRMHVTPREVTLETSHPPVTAV